MPNIAQPSRLRRMLSTVRGRANAFGRDERGTIAMMAGAAFPVLMLTAGVAVDLSSAYRAKTDFQSAVDAGALAMSKVIVRGRQTFNGTRESQQQMLSRAQRMAKDVVYASMRNYDRTGMSFEFELHNGNCAQGDMVLSAGLRHDVFFEGLGQAMLGQDFQPEGRKLREFNLGARTAVACGNKSVEVALVLDNSGSMRWNGKMTTLKNASNSFVETLHSAYSGAAGLQDPLRISLVPFAGMVNVGKHNKSKDWMDLYGESPIHNENLNWAEDPIASPRSVPGYTHKRYVDASGKALTRFSIYDAMNVTWAGCVEARPYPYHVQDDAPDRTKPETMIVPAFAPDTPDNWDDQRERAVVTLPVIYCEEWKRKNHKWKPPLCKRWSNGYRGPKHPIDKTWPNYYGGGYDEGVWQGASTATGWADGDKIDEDWYENNYIKDSHNFPFTNKHYRDPAYVGKVEDQYKRQKWTWKYRSNPQKYDINANNQYRYPKPKGWNGGPNYMCHTTPVTELTGSKGTIKNAINAMGPNGSTNIPQGVIWGWRTLSEAKPFTAGRAYDEPNNKKIMVVMTDGNNTYFPLDRWNYSRKNKSFYAAYGLSANGRIFDGYTTITNPSHNYNTFTKAMDDHLLKVCANAKAKQIQIYTIAFDVPNGSSVKTMLEQCASPDAAGNPNYFDAANSQQLNDAFSQIADRISELAISQ